MTIPTTAPGIPSPLLVNLVLQQVPVLHIIYIVFILQPRDGVWGRRELLG
jgi:hypothetical protein